MSPSTRRIIRAVFVIGLFAWLIFSSIFQNTVRVYIAKDVVSHDVVVTWLSEDSTEQILFRRARTLSNVGNTYGDNIFHIYYQDKKATVRHFKTKWWHMHKYEFKLNMDDSGDLYVEFVVEGSDGVSIRKKIAH